MKRNYTHIHVLACLLLGLVLAGPVAAQVPAIISYQGMITSGGEPVDGTGYFKFALVDATGMSRYWTHDDTGIWPPPFEPDSSIELVVENGLFMLHLGDSNLPKMQDMDVSVFNNADVHLRIWFSEDDVTFTQLTPDQPFGSSGYAIMSSRVPAGSITATELAANSVTTFAIQENAVTASQLAPLSVTAAAIENATITSNKIDWTTMPGMPDLLGYAESGTFVSAPLATGTDAIALGYGAQAVSEYAAVGGGYENVAGGARSTVAGGLDNQATGFTSTIGGGAGNRAERDFGVVAGGQMNVASQPYTTIAGGKENQASRQGATVGGGEENVAGWTRATVSGGWRNQAMGWYGFIGGGANNFITNDYAVISGGSGNRATNEYSTVAGGRSNVAGGQYATVGGGYSNNAQNDESTVGGGQSNIARGIGSTVAGGFMNEAAGEDSFVGGGNRNKSTHVLSVVTGGFSNTASNLRAMVGGGRFNAANGMDSAIVGGEGNRASANYAFVGGGRTNDSFATASAIVGGQGNEVSAGSDYGVIGGGLNNRVSGAAGVIPGGSLNVAGANAFAAGSQARAMHSGSFVWADASIVDFVDSVANNSVTFRAAGGYRLYSNSAMSLGAGLNPNATTWSALSDREAKENFEEIDTRAVLEGVANLPLTAWTYKADPGQRRYIGPVAQDFHAAFGLGDDVTINTLDFDGVALAAIQALYEENQELKARLERLEAMLGAQ